MKRLLLIAVIFAAGAASGQAQAATHTCKGAPSEYLAKFSAVYPEPRVYLESQGWLKPPGETSIHHFEHIHIGACFPYKETWVQPNGSQTLDVEYVFHHVQDYTILKSNSQFVDGQNSGGGYVATVTQIARLQKKMNASMDTTTMAFQHYVMNPVGVNCRKTFKATLTTVRSNSSALVDEWFPAAHWTTNIAYSGNTRTCSSPELLRDQVRGRDWIKGGAHGDGYIYSNIFSAWRASKAKHPVPEPWRPLVSASGGHVTAYVDPHFHMHPDDPGIWHRDYGLRDIGKFRIKIPTGTFPPGWHRLVYVVERADHAAVMVVPFRVR